MLLYHSSNVVVQAPRLLGAQRPLDFGLGFYLTSNLEQAQRWAKRTVARRHDGTATTSVFEAEVPFPSNLKVLRFEQPDDQWLDIVVANRRRDKHFQNDYDIVIGPVANDQTILTINLYMEGLLQKEAAIAELLPQRLTDQYAFRTEAALALLRFKEVLYV